MHSEWELTPQDMPEALLRAVGWHLLVRMPEAKKKTDGGLHVPEKVADRESLAVMVAEVVGVGEDCYRGEKFSSPWCRVGDWVIFRSYAGTRFAFKGREYRLLNDDAIEGVTALPEEIEKP
jgi:co-chaperonin GroES (HSP10)